MVPVPNLRTTTTRPQPRRTDVPTNALRYKNEGNGALLARVPPRTKRILDVGCGPGDNARVLGRRGYAVWGLTDSVEEAAVARAFCVDVWVGDVEVMPLPKAEPFDVLFMSHVLEHLVEPAAALTRLAPLVASDGLVVAAVPNMAHWSARLRVLRGDWSRDDTGLFDRTHLHFWSYETGAQIFAHTPFDLLEVTGTDPSVPLRPLRTLAPRAAAAVDDAIGRRFPNLTASQVILVAARR